MINTFATPSACEQAVAAGMFVHASALKGQRLGPLTLAWQLCTED
jgi:hypothetical protein